MKIPKTTFIKQFCLLQQDLSTVMQSWPSGASFDMAKNHAETVATLVAGQIGLLQEMPIQLNRANPIELQNELEKLKNLMLNIDEKQKFSEYIAMIDSLINGE